MTNNIGLHQLAICLQHVNGKFKIQCFGRQYRDTVFLPDFISAQHMVQVIEGKFI